MGAPTTHTQKSDDGLQQTSKSSGTSESEAPVNGHAANGENGVDADANGHAEQNGDAVETSENRPLTITLEHYLGSSLTVQMQPTDSLFDIRHFISEIPSLSHLNAYAIYIGDSKVNDYEEVGSIEGITDGSTLHLVPIPYTEATSRQHVERVSHLLSGHSGMGSDIATSSGDEDVYTSILTCPALRAHLNESGDPILTTTADEGSGEAKTKKNKGKKDKMKSSSADKDGSKDAKLVVPSDGEYSASYEEVFGVPSWWSRYNKHIECVKTIRMSAWNKPTRNRTMQGDLFYIEVETVESDVLHITASTSGFFVNNSTASVCDPTPKGDCMTHTLIGLLEKASPTFSARYKELLASTQSVDKHNLDRAMPFAHSKSWVVPAVESKDVVKNAMRSFHQSSPSESLTTPRDWNEEYQVGRAMPMRDLHERSIRDRTLNNVITDFVEASRAGAVHIVHGEMLPINPMEPESQHVYVVNNIFYSFAVDSRGMFSVCGGDKIAHASARHDLEGIVVTNKAAMAIASRMEEVNQEKEVEANHTDTLSTLLTSLVDYRGRRIICQAIIPGVLQSDHASMMVHGSIETGGKMVWDERVHEQVEVLAKEMHVKSHTVKDGEGDDVKIATGADTKCLRGSDSRLYLLDLNRCLPRDANYPDATHVTKLLRSELLELYAREQEMKVKSDAYNQLAATKKKEREAREEKEGKKEMTEEEILKEREDFQNLKYDFTAPIYNCDLFTPVEVVDTDGDLEKDKEQLVAVSKFLLDSVIASFVKELHVGTQSPLDGVTLTHLMHQRGINMRYLGTILNSLRELRNKKEKSGSENNNAAIPVGGEHVTFTESVVFGEIVARAAKAHFRSFIQDVSFSHTGRAVSNFLNSLLRTSVIHMDKFTSKGAISSTAPPSPSSGSKKNKKNKKSHKSDQTPSDASANDAGVAVTHVLTDSFLSCPSKVTLPGTKLWKKIHRSAKEAFGYDMQQSDLDIISHSSLLRNFCKLTGISLRLRNFNFTSDSIVREQDVVSLNPVVRHCNPATPSVDGRAFFDAGRFWLMQGVVPKAMQVFSDALSLLVDAGGPATIDVAMCYANFALALYHSGEYEQAVIVQQKAAIIYERLRGMDAPEVAQAYMTMGLFLHQTGHVADAFRITKRAVQIISLLTDGKGHRELAAVYTNLGVVAQENGQYSSAISVLSLVKRMLTKLYGREHVLLAACHHQLAYNHFLSGSFREALQEEKSSYRIWCDVNGAEDRKAQESLMWVKTLTVKAVEKEKAGADRTKQEKGKKKPDEDDVEIGIKGDLPLDELVKFIGNDGGIVGSVSRTSHKQSHSVPKVVWDVTEDEKNARANFSNSQTVPSLRGSGGRSGVVQVNPKSGGSTSTSAVSEVAVTPPTYNTTDLKGFTVVAPRKQSKGKAKRTGKAKQATEAI